MLLGFPLLAGLGFAATALSLVALVLLSFFPVSVMAWLTLACLLGMILFSTAESMAEGRITIRPSGESSGVSRHFSGICALAFVAAVAASLCLILNFGTLILRGDGMVPVIYPGELILYHKRVAATDLGPGRVIAFRVSARSSWGHAGEVVIGRILAAPGDTIAIQEGHYRVSGKESVEVSPTGRLPVVVDIPEAPAQVTAPTGCFFVVQEQPTKALDSRTLSWARSEDIVGTKLWLLSRRGLAHPLR
jgi:signal peptidase I